MLQKIHIQNYAIIEDLEVSFTAGLNIITGETGAGKSILMGALSLTLGERADASVLFNKEKKCIVEASYSIEKNNSAKQFLVDNELDEEDILVIRREIALNGKSRAFVNDTPVTLLQLKKLSSLLVDLHQQFDALELGEAGFQRNVMDSLAGQLDEIKKYKELFREYQKTKTELEALKSHQANANAELEYHRFLFHELEEAGFKENELEDLDNELKLLNNSENIRQQLSAVYFELKESEQPLVQQIKSLNGKLHSIENFHQGLMGLVQRIQSLQVELNDIAEELQHINDSVQYSPERIQWINDRLDVGYKLLKKHGAQTTGELIALQASLENKLTGLLNLAEMIGEKEKVLQKLAGQCEEESRGITESRNKAIVPFVEKVNQLLVQVGMPNAKIKVQLTQVSLYEYGNSEIEFLFDANVPSGKQSSAAHFESLQKVASGGELSRLMLCIKSLVANKLQLPVLIFDEIDTGISGEAARQVGIIMKQLSNTHQLISITHQPQIAAKADTHFFIYKNHRENKIITEVKILSKEERVVNIAKMIGGEKPTDAALKNARELVGE